MDGTATILHRAERRAETLRARYRSSRAWTGEPLDVIGDGATVRPDGPAVITRDETVSYAELDRRIDLAASALLAAGVSAGDPVLLVVGNDLASVVAAHAVLRVDGVVLLVPRSAGLAHRDDIIVSTGVVFGVDAARGKPGTSADAHGLRWVAMPAWQTDAPTIRHAPRRAADAPSFVLFTSGTTSRPKGVVHSASTLVAASRNYIAGTALTDADRLFVVSPLGSVTGVVQALFVAPLLGAPVILEDRWDPPQTYRLLRDSGGTWYGGPDRLLDRLLDEAVTAGGPVPLTAVYLGGTMLDPRVVARIEDDFGIVVMRAYGSSEVPVSTSGLRGDPIDARRADDGVALGDTELAFGSDLDPGELRIRGPHAFLGYTDPDDDTYAFHDGWFHTGDVAEVRDGRVKIVGRLRDIVIRNGLKIPVAEVEEAVNKLVGVRDCAGYTVEDSTTGERLAVALLPESGAEVGLVDVIDGLIASGLAKYKVPEELVVWHESFPLNANGKVERNRLHDLAAGRPRELAARLR